MEPLGPVVSSSQVPSLNPPKQELKVPFNLTEEKEAMAHKGETEKPDRGRCLTFFCLNLLTKT
jgi:hypothetical protein